MYSRHRLPHWVEVLLGAAILLVVAQAVLVECGVWRELCAAGQALVGLLRGRLP